MSETEPQTDETERVDPAKFIAEDGENVAPDHQETEGIEPPENAGGSGGRMGNLQQMAFSTEPTKPLEDVESVWDPEKGGMTRVTRGFQKMLGFDGVPAALDIVIGLGEFAVSFDPEGSSEETTETPEPTDGGDPISGQIQ